MQNKDIPTDTEENQSQIQADKFKETLRKITYVVIALLPLFYSLATDYNVIERFQKDLKKTFVEISRTFFILLIIYLKFA